MKKRVRIISIALLFSFLNELMFPITAYALTGGPSQPEVESFEPVGTSEMVDLFSGDFNYNIPLMDVDGYPINLAYHSGVTMDQEASWVGLGWNLNPGVINRNMRGIPDDFQGDQIQKIQYVKPDRTYGTNLNLALEFFGKEPKGGKFMNALKKIIPQVGLGINYNNYKGLGIESSISPAINAGHNFKTKYLKSIGFNASLDIASSSKDGFSVKPKAGINASLGKEGKSFGAGANLSVGMTVSSRGGVKSLTIQGGGSVSSSKLDKINGVIKDLGGNGISNLSGSFVSFASQTYTPAIGMQMENLNLSLTVKIGGTAWALNPNHSITGYYASQKVAELYSTRRAYGALYEEVAGSDDMFDFNREKDGQFSTENPTLAIPVFTYDIYSASGQGVGGMFKPFRSDIPVVHDPSMKNTSVGGSLGVEVAIGNLVKAGLNPSFNYSEVKAGEWSKYNDLVSKITYSKKSRLDPTLEPSYIKSVGEKMAVDTNTIPYANINYPVRPVMAEIAPLLLTKNVFLKGNKLEKKVGSNDHQEFDISSVAATKTKRDRRNQLFSYLTQEEADYCLEKDIEYYPASTLPTPNVNPSTLSRNRGKSKQLSEITVTNDQGMRYVYGIAANNNVQYDISFTNALDPDDATQSTPAHYCSIGQVVYDTNLNFDVPQFTSRKYKGNDHAINVTKTPTYAHSYLLTAVLSPDYVDVNGDGPDPENDYGNYTKLSYYKIADSYKWRVPYSRFLANYSEGLKSDKNDDNANIMYGEKEMWLVSKIEGRNHYALFYISKREDALGVKDIHGGGDTSARSYKLDKIELYTNTFPANQLIKTVHFEYNYELCQGVDNNTGVLGSGQTGKLTLKKLYFTYGSSEKGKFNYYNFTYNSGSKNPTYNIKSYDRWGNYKPNSCSSDIAASVDYPYVNQDKSLTDEYTQAWSLSSIELPSGGVINVEYESDDYAYVQDRRAMQMAKLLGFSDAYPNINTPTSATPTLSHDLYDGENPREYMFFELPASLKHKNAGLIKKYLMDMKDNLVYFNCLINLNSQAKADNREYVRGYTDIEDAGVVNMNGVNPVGWLKVKLQDDGKSHPIAKSAWQYARMNLPYIVYPGSNLRKKSEGSDVAEAIIRGLLGFIFDAADMIQGINNKLRGANFGKYVDPNNSWIRINNMTGAKLGGGTRVKRLTLDDKWNSLSGSDPHMVYGQEYSYTILDTYNGEKQLISSGVASYEPTIGNDENPFKMPDAYKKENMLVPDDDFYTEEPYGESLFPSAQVGYSRVTVKSYVPEDVNLSKHGTGKVVHKFYTARDFPTFTQKTDIASQNHKTSGIFKLVGFVGEEHAAMTQGFQVELNDMHGKPDAVLNYNQSNINSENDADAFSGVKYYYQVENENSLVKKLDSHFKVINANNQISVQNVGLESEMIMDTREQKSFTVSGGMGLNLDVFLVGPIPVAAFAFSGWPDFSSEFTSYRSAVIMRVVNRYGILKRTVAFEEGSSIATENIILDAETGAPLLTRTYNEFEDPVYNTTFPAHWVYDGMGQGYKNTGMELEVCAHTNTLYTNAIMAKLGASKVDVSTYLTEGDEVILTETPVSGPTVTGKKWVHKNSGLYYLINKDGQVLAPVSTTTYVAKVIRSGRRNMQNIPVMQFTSLSSPAGTSSLIIQDSTKVLSASATSFSSKWRTTLPLIRACDSIHVTPRGETYDTTYCKCNCLDSKGVTVNPFVTSIKGSWRKEKDWVYYDSRVAIDTSLKTNIRKNGAYNSFGSFYTYSSGQWGEISSKGKWTQTNQVTKYDKYGGEAETKDALDRYSAAVNVYYYNLPGAVASNAKYGQIGFLDEFGTSSTECPKSHLDFFTKSCTETNDAALAILEKAHTGRSCIEMGADKVAYAKHPIVSDEGPFDNGTSAYKLDQNDLNGYFNPDSGTYIIGAWVRVGKNPKRTTYLTDTVNSCRVEVAVSTAATTTVYYARPSGPVIEGWQRIEGKFYVPKRGKTIKISLVAAKSGFFPGGETVVKTWFDDVRVHPIDSKMKTYIYDALNLYLMAELDENNYATFYEYNAQKELIRVKKETENGIVTLKESRSHKHKK